ncbi:methylated-DNA--[protein]-cysteine S-methyltransferase [Alistipes sp.]|uniref:methylated-DNA--[protein]-cysteine S-methyltransferase n=1 Tax=Alistipes sp. TaxID=1872444 RepID=UPI0025C230AB|nr:methylated-DNA--[protein]-cysteine S-methyltransferase [Alistipes sp.]
MAPSDSKIRIQRYATPCGDVVLGSHGDSLCLCDWVNARHRERIDKRLCRMLHADFTTQTTPVIRQAEEELEAYFAGQRQCFDVPLRCVGTDFQIEVWQKLLQIPCGEVISYAELARRLHREGAIRAVANAVGANPISLFVPCHRIIGSNHTLTGYAGGLAAKRQLLEMEHIMCAARE